MRRVGFVAAGSLLFSLASAAQATLVRADFNDNSPGPIKGQTGGSNFGPSAWDGATGPSIVPGDLVAPPSTKYALTQTAGTAQSVQSAASVLSANGQVNRAPAANLSGTVWFSFLVNPASADARGGIGFNSTNTTSADPRILAVGPNLYVNQVMTNNVFTVGQAALVVGRILFNVNGVNDRTSVWVNPDVNALAFGTLTPTYDTSGTDAYGTALSLITISSYTGVSGSASGVVDAIRVSDSATAQTDVTGVPEPTATVFVLAGMTALLTRRREKESRE